LTDLEPQVSIADVTVHPGSASNEHVVQFYGQDSERLAKNAAAFLGRSLERGGAGLVIAGERHREAIRQEVQQRTSAQPLLEERLVFLDDAATLGEFMRDGAPDAELFAHTVGDRARALRDRFGAFRAYGEMVGRLWNEREYRAAIALESLWNDLQKESAFDLFCGYPIDVLGDEFQVASIRPLLSAHHRVVPAVADSFGQAIRRARNEVIGDSMHGLNGLAGGALCGLGVELPPVEGAMLRLRSALPRYADEILAKARSYALSEEVR
jgi:hypothetical protein